MDIILIISVNEEKIVLMLILSTQFVKTDKTYTESYFRWKSIGQLVYVHNCLCIYFIGGFFFFFTK